MLQRVHEQEGYPVRDGAVSRWWLTAAVKPGETPQPELGSWVAVADQGSVDERVLGHVALHPAAGECLPLWTAGTGAGVESLAVVSRLFTDRTVPGSGTALLLHALEQAHARRRIGVLEVDAAGAAHGWYLRRGWAELGRTPQQWGHRLVDSVAMVAPGP